MRCTFCNKPRRKRLQEDILEHVRRLRREIDPALLKKTRDVINGAGAGEEKIDQRKNWETVMRVLAMKPEDEALRKEVARWVAERRK